MKYQIENLLQDEKIICHEIRATSYENNEVLLHFFITQNKDKNSLPEFKMGYERYMADAKNTKDRSSKPDEDLLQTFALIKLEDNHNLLFNQPLSTTDTTPRNVAEMADNTIYQTDDIVNQKTYLETKDDTLRAYHSSDNDNNLNNPFSNHIINNNIVSDTNSSETIKEIVKNENKTSHSIWSSEIHFDKFERCSNDELLALLKKYKPYINLRIPSNLDTESPTNIDMESIFGASFDVLRLKNKMFNKDDHDHDDYMGQTI